MNAAEVLAPLTADQQQLVMKHVPWAMNMGRKYAALGRLKEVPCEDLQQEACYGLCKAAQRFVAGQADFKTYAFLWCKKYILLALNDRPFMDKEDVEASASGLPEELYRAEIDKQVQQLLALLTDRERTIVCAVFGVGCQELSFGQIAEKMGLTSRRVHTLYEKAMTRMEFHAFDNYKNDNNDK